MTARDTSAYARGIDARRKLVASLLDEGLTMREIGIQIGVSSGRAGQIYADWKQDRLAEKLWRNPPERDTPQWFYIHERFATK